MRSACSTVSSMTVDLGRSEKRAILSKQGPSMDCTRSGTGWVLGQPLRSDMCSS